MKLFDSHCHLDFDVFRDGLDELLQSCQQAGVARILIPGVKRQDWQRQLQLARHYPQLCIALGLHPCFMEEHQAEDLQVLADLLNIESVVAVGEIGLDFWLADTDQQAQISLFERQLLLAREAQLPVIIHSRKANDQVASRLRKLGISQGIIHAFSGSMQQAEVFLGLGMKFGVGGAITYPRAQRLRQIISRLPLTALLLETDAPDMPLSGHQGQANRPDLLPLVFRQLCELRPESEEAIAEQLWLNTTELFAS